MPKTITRLRDLTPDQGNANKHTAPGTSMMQSSIEECGFGDSLTVDKHGVVISGNQRLETLADVGLDDPIVVQTDGKRPVVHQRIDLEASDPKAKRLALFSNRVGQVNLEWDTDVLRALQDDGVSLAGLWGDDELRELFADAPELDAATYTPKIVAPIYEPTGDRPKVAELFDDSKTRELVSEIEAAELPDEIAEFLRRAAERHTVFDFRNIAEYYAQADEKTQRLMERSALVIIDFDQAIENGFVRLTERLGKIADVEGWN